MKGLGCTDALLTIAFLLAAQLAYRKGFGFTNVLLTLSQSLQKPSTVSMSLISFSLSSLQLLFLSEGNQCVVVDGAPSE